MRREYQNKEAIPEGCILWLPLTSATDLRERVTGHSIIIEPNHADSMVWDANEGAFRITPFNRTETLQPYYYMATLDYPNFREQFQNDNYSVIIDVKNGGLSTSKGPFAWPHTEDGGTGVPSRVKSAWTLGNSENWPNSGREKFRISLLFDATYKTTYYNYTQYSQSTMSGTIPHTPSRWTPLYDPKIAFGSSGTSNGSSYIYNFMIFNRKLTIEEAMAL